MYPAGAYLLTGGSFAGKQWRPVSRRLAIQFNGIVKTGKNVMRFFIFALFTTFVSLLCACGGGNAGGDEGSSGGVGNSSVVSSAASSSTAASTSFTAATLKSACYTTLGSAASSSSGSSADTSSFGITTSTSYYTVDTGAGLVFKIRRGNYSASTQAPGDIASMVYNGVEYQDQTAGSQINAGAGYLYTDVGEDAVVLDATQVDSDHIRISVTAGDMTHYYLAHRGEAKIYMATVFSSEPNQDSESFVRYIVRAKKSLLPAGPAASELDDTTSTIEASDIFATASGETRSKHYSNQRLRDWYYIGASGTNVGLWMVRGNSEGMSGGPFYRSLLNQGTSSQQQITYIVNYGMAQTEDYRTGIVNSYALVFTDGSAPDVLDTGWYDDMGLSGWVRRAARGTVTGSSISGMDSGYTYTVGFSNTAAQYWTTADSSTGAFSCAGMLPGDYTVKVYKNELVVATSSVTVSAGTSTTAGSISITDDPSATTALWRIGDWDGTPTDLLNGDKITSMHPSDIRMSSWTPGTFTVGTSTAASGFPAYSWQGVNGSQAISFTLTASQLKASTVRIGITTAYAGGRPRITVNSWTSSMPTASSQPSTRNMTVGTYRGNNKMYTYSVPASALVEGSNTLTLSIISGSSGTTWLSPGAAYDAVDFIQ
jgi:rhamnogalacturonan endolyase